MPLKNPITEPQVPSAIARDAEVTVAINSHAAAADPHPVYLTQAEGDARYGESASRVFFKSGLPPGNIAGNSIGFGWNSVQPGFGVAELCNYSGLGGGDAFNFFRVPGNPSTTPTLSDRVARIDLSGGYIQTSDKRVKKSFSKAPGLSAILSLNPQKYSHYECLGFDPKTKEIKLGQNFLEKVGFFAQDVYKVLPEAVPTAVPTTEGEDELYGIDYSCIVACLVKAVQEQQEQIDLLKSQISKR